jgi:mono/diheme cytochrome c family protein
LKFRIDVEEEQPLRPNQTNLSNSDKRGPILRHLRRISSGHSLTNIQRLSLPVVLLSFCCAAAAGQGNPEAGKTVFMNQCAVCHGEDASGKSAVAKSLSVNIPDYRSEEVHRLTDADIQKVIKIGKGNMPPVTGLSAEDITNVIAFIRSFPLQQPEEKVQQGSAVRGEGLFTGRIAFKNGGPPCSSCHNVSGLPFPSGGTLGPSLTREYSKLGPEGMDTALHTLFFPAMAPLYDPHPLTVAEQADLKAFFEEADSRPPAKDRTIAAVLIALGGFGILVLITWALWRDRLRSVRRTLVETAMSKGSVRT